MKKKVLTLMLSIVMVVTMSVPTIATTKVASCGTKPTYVVIGDSITAGYNQAFGGLGYDDKKYDDILRPYGRGREIGSDRTDTRTIDYIKKAYPSLIENRLGGIDEENSYNFSYPSYRAREFCYLFGLLNEEEITELKNDGYATKYFNYDNLDSIPYAKADSMMNAAEDAKKSIKKANIISIELGMNDLSSIVMGDDINKVINQVLELVRKNFGLSISFNMSDVAQADDINATDKATINRILEAVDVIKSHQTGLCEKCAAIGTALTAVEMIGIDISGVIREVKSILKEHVNDADKYLNRLVAYIRELNPNACIIVLNSYNPARGALDGADISEMLEGLGMDGILDVINNINLNSVLDLLTLLIQPSINKMNRNIDSVASRYNCTVADITKVIPGSIDKWLTHPTADGHRQIADSVIKAIEKDCAKRGYKLTAKAVAIKNCNALHTICTHKRTELINVQEATYIADGYTGDTGCMICGDIVSKGEVIPHLTIEGTDINKLTSKKKSITARWNTVADIDGYQIQASTSKKFAKHIKKATVKDAAAISQKIGKLKAGTKYYVRIRTIKIVDEANTVYSDWSTVKSIKTTRGRG